MSVQSVDCHHHNCEHMMHKKPRVSLNASLAKVHTAWCVVTVVVVVTVGWLHENAKSFEIGASAPCAELLGLA